MYVIKFDKHQHWFFAGIYWGMKQFRLASIKEQKNVRFVWSSTLNSFSNNDDGSLIIKITAKATIWTVKC